MNLEIVSNILYKSVPALKFTLKAMPISSINDATVNKAKRLINKLNSDECHEIDEFFDYLVSIDKGNWDEDIKSLTNHPNFIRFLFYLTVYEGKLPLMVEAHTLKYLPILGINPSKVQSMQYYPSMIDINSVKNPYMGLFENNVALLKHYINNLHKDYVRVITNSEGVDDYIDLYTSDVIGYIEP